ncbi:transposon Tf2-9 polyprotein [Trichonephila clavipes]|nr:transposon Tf2-9 polyprotein [Trichonephila clavipes]
MPPPANQKTFTLAKKPLRLVDFTELRETSHHYHINPSLTPKQCRRFTLITDHKPLIAIFGSKRGLPVLAATRLLHYALILQSFEFDIIFRKTIEHGNAEFLSRLPKTSEELEVKDDITIFQMSQIEALPVTSKELRRETSKDIELGPLLRALREGKDLQGEGSPVYH